MRLIHVRATLGAEWHRIDDDVKPTMRSALCTFTPKTSSVQESPWCETWRNRVLSPPGAYCEKCDDIASRLIRPITPTPELDGVGKKDAAALLGDDFARLLEDL